MQDAQLQGLQVGDCLGLWGDAEAIGNAADAGRSRIPGLLRGAMAEPGLSSSRCVLVLQHIHSAIHPFSATGRHQGDVETFMLLVLCMWLFSIAKHCCLLLQGAHNRAVKANGHPCGTVSAVAVQGTKRRRCWGQRGKEQWIRQWAGWTQRARASGRQSRAGTAAPGAVAAAGQPQ